MYQIFIHSSADGHLGCFHVLGIVNSAAVNIGVQHDLSCSKLDYYSMTQSLPQSGLTDTPYSVDIRYGHVICFGQWNVDESDNVQVQPRP